MEDNKTNSAPFRRLEGMIILIITLVSLAPLFLTGIIVIGYFSEAYQRKVDQHLRELVHKHSRQIDFFLNDRLGDIRALARSASYQLLTDPEYLSFRLKILREEYGNVFVDLGVVDEHGVQMTYAGPFNLVGADYSKSEWFGPAASSEHFVSDVFTGLRGKPHFIITVRQIYFNHPWVLRATVDFQAFNALVEGIRIGRTGFACIINQKGEFQTLPAQGAKFDPKPFLDFIQNGLAGEKVRVTRYRDSSGNEYVLAMAPVKGGEWVLCGQQDLGDALAPLDQSRQAAWAAFLTSAILILGAALFISRRLVHRLMAARQETKQMSEKVIEAGRLASIGELAAGIAHEINNPVAIMVEEAGWIQDLLKDPDPGSPENLEELARAAGQIRTQGARCKLITHKLLSFARRTDPCEIEVDLNEVIKETAGLCQQKIRYARIGLKMELAVELPKVLAPPAELQQVILNLVNNAVDAIEAKEGEVTLTTKARDGKVVFEVSDTGSGIPDPLIARIFDPFFTTKSVGQGTGLGLSIVFGIVKKLGGEISVRSQVGRGTTFAVELPSLNCVHAEENNPVRP
ncbi:MAG: ATP-binding protein [Pseudomonadota bacterium]